MADVDTSTAGPGTSTRLMDASSPRPASPSFIKSPHSTSTTTRYTRTRTSFRDASPSRIEDEIRRRERLARLEAELARSRVEEELARTRLSRSLSESRRAIEDEAERSRLSASLHESRVAEEVARNTSHILARELAQAREELGRQRYRNPGRSHRNDDEDEVYTTSRVTSTRVHNVDSATAGSRRAASARSDADSLTTFEAVRARLAERTAEINALQSENDRLRRRLRDAEEDGRAKDAHIDRAEADSRSVRRELRDTQERVQDLEAAVKSKNDHIASLERGNLELEDMLAASRRDVASVEERLDAVRTELEQVEKDAQFRIDSARQENNQLQSEIEDVAVANKRLESECDSLREQVQEYEKYTAELRADLRKRSDQVDRVTDENKTLGRTIDRLEKEVQELERRITSNSRHFESEMADARQRQASLRSELDAVMADKAVAVSARDDLERETRDLRIKLSEAEGRVRKFSRAVEDKTSRIAEMTAVLNASRSKSKTVTKVVQPQRIHREGGQYDTVVEQSMHYRY